MRFLHDNKFIYTSITRVCILHLNTNLNVLQQLLLAPADILQFLLLLWSEVVRHWGDIREHERLGKWCPKYNAPLLFSLHFCLSIP